jgi:hypothetical protein
MVASMSRRFMAGAEGPIVMAAQREVPAPGPIMGDAIQVLGEMHERFAAGADIVMDDDRGADDFRRLHSGGQRVGGIPAGKGRA